MKTLLTFAIALSAFTSTAIRASESFSPKASADSFELAFLDDEVEAKLNCRYSTECRPGEHCLNGQCVQRDPTNRCSFKSDCPPAEDCINGYCRRR